MANIGKIELLNKINDLYVNWQAAAAAEPEDREWHESLFWDAVAVLLPQCPDVDVRRDCDTEVCFFRDGSRIEWSDYRKEYVIDV